MNHRTRDGSIDLQAVAHRPGEEARAWSLDFVTTACADRRVLALVVIGSAIRPVSIVSDVDFLLIHSGAEPQFDLPPIDVDLRLYSAADAETLLAKGHDLLGWAVRLGHLVCEKNGYWSRLRSRLLHQLPFPSSSVADERAAKAQALFEHLSQIGDEDAALEQFVALLTHRARARLLAVHIFPASRPELPRQLAEIGELELAASLAQALDRRTSVVHHGPPVSPED